MSEIVVFKLKISVFGVETFGDILPYRYPVSVNQELSGSASWSTKDARAMDLVFTSGHQCNDCLCYFLASD